VEEGDTGLARVFAGSFAAAKAAGFKVLVTAGHSAPHGINISPQLHITGQEPENDFTIGTK
jgi:hypothetical protein